MLDRFRVIAHRGASAHAPENTLPAFRRALDEGAREIEIDIRFSSDEEIIVFHDDRLDRKTPLRGRVRHYPASALRRADIGSWFDRTHPEASERFAGTCVVSLRSVFEDLGPRVHYHIEMKGFEDLLPLRALQLIDEFDLRRCVTMTSFSMRPLRQMRKLTQALPLCLLLRDSFDAVRSAEFRPQLEGRSTEDVQDYWIDQAASEQFQQVGIRAADMSPRAAARSADRGLSIRGWGVRNREDLSRLHDLGAIGATVDWPGVALEHLEQRLGSHLSNLRTTSSSRWKE